MRSEMRTHGLQISEGILGLKLSVHFGTLLFNCVRKLNHLKSNGRLSSAHITFLLKICIPSQ